MKITVKTTQRKVLQIEVESGDTVAKLKAKIHELQGHPVAVQKIIYSGNILTDDKTIDSCGIKEKDFFVLMVSKPKPTPTTPPWATTDIASEPTVPELTTIPAVSSSEVTQETTTSSQSTSDYGSSSLGDLLSGQNLQGAIDNIVDMGFPRDEVMRAILARSNNADRTVGYRTERFPHPELEQQQQHVTEDELAAIEKLRMLGFSQQKATEAYFTCGKNEEAAANYLFDNIDQ